VISMLDRKRPTPTRSTAATRRTAVGRPAAGQADPHARLDLGDPRGACTRSSSWSSGGRPRCRTEAPVPGRSRGRPQSLSSRDRPAPGRSGPRPRPPSPTRPGSQFGWAPAGGSARRAPPGPWPVATFATVRGPPDR
jgi:hypothetical protein